MKVEMGKYVNHISAVDVAETILFWLDEEHPLVDRLGDFVHYNKHCSALLNWVNSKRERKIKIRIDPWDTWGMDSTLAPIILPMLIQLKETKQGSPFTDDDDIPPSVREYLKEQAVADPDGDGDIHLRWDYVLDAMIYSFDYIANNRETYDVPFNAEKIKAEQEKVQYGFTLFGKYFQALWD